METEQRISEEMGISEEIESDEDHHKLTIITPSMENEQPNSEATHSNSRNPNLNTDSTEIPPMPKPNGHSSNSQTEEPLLNGLFFLFTYTIPSVH